MVGKRERGLGGWNLLWIVALGLVAQLWTPGLAGAYLKYPPKALAEDEYLLISLRQLRSSLHDPMAARLFGATRLVGYVLSRDAGGPDCLLIMDVEPDRPALRLDDLAVAWHSVRRTPHNRPACTIDPRPETLRKLQKLAQEIFSVQEATQVEPLLAQWKRVASAPQDVRVFGVDPDTHFARVMVDADYHLKNVCNGAAAIEGVESLTRILLRKAEQEIREGGALSMGASIYNRFWFNPGKTLYRADDSGSVILDECRVVLLTEEEALTPTGRLAGKSRPHPEAKRFAENFTRQFQKAARREPVYRELENLYRFVAVAVLLEQAADPETMGMLEELFRKVKIERHPARPTLPGRYSVDKLEGTRPVADGVIHWQIFLPTCGGVSMDIRLDLDRDRSPDPQRIVPAFTEFVSQSRPSPRSVWWVVKSPLLRSKPVMSL